MNTSYKNVLFYSLILILALLSGLSGSPWILDLADSISIGFVTILKWLSLPMIFLSILATTSSLKSKTELFVLGKNIAKYTLFTTLIASSIALGYFLLLKPANANLAEISSHVTSPTGNNLFGLLLLGTIGSTLILSITILSCSLELRQKIHARLSSLYKKVMGLIQAILKTMPIAIWAFIVLFIKDLDGLTLQSLALYLSCIIFANLTQGLVVLPTLLKAKKISPIKTFKGMFPALSIAFWSKSSGVALPIAIDCVQSRLGVSKKVAGFSLPLCTTINMNACAAFILITVLFVSQSHGVSYTSIELATWVVIATLAAIGNAGVPMGCYTLSCALLAYMGVPLYLLGLILPFYALIDMLESAINVWSDGCVTMIVEQDFQRTVKDAPPLTANSTALSERSFEAGRAG